MIAAGANVVFAVENAGGRCTASTANDRYAVCGYYEEWSTDNASIRLVDEVELDLSKYREFCNAN